MHREYSIPTNPTRRRNWFILGGALAFGLFCLVLSPFLLLGSLINANAKPHVETAPASAAVSGWRIEVLGSLAAENVTQFNRSFPTGKVLLLPANAEFSIVTQPVDVRGELEESAISGAWKQNGGRIASGEATPEGVRQIMKAPRQPGLYRFVWNPRASPESLLPAPASSTLAQPNPGLDVLVLAEAEIATKGERTTVKVKGKSIGGYLDASKSKSKLVQEHAALYQIPRFFAVLTPETAKLRLGPDFELGNLIAYMDHTDKDGRKVFTTERHTDVLPIRMELIDKLVKLRERLQQKGLKVSRFGVTSGFRTPDYNKSVRGAAYSRHAYGDAVDIFIDENNNHHMDDLNRDGKFDRKDGLIIANACRELEREGLVVPGGIGLYEWTGTESVRSHVHIDCRGYISRWGLIDNKRSFTWWPAEEFQGEGGE